MRLSGIRALIALSNGRALIVGFGASLLATVINKEVSETVTRFLTALDTSSSNGLSCYSYNT